MLATETQLENIFMKHEEIDIEIESTRWQDIKIVTAHTDAGLDAMTHEIYAEVPFMINQQYEIETYLAARVVIFCDEHSFHYAGMNVESAKAIVRGY